MTFKGALAFVATVAWTVPASAEPSSATMASNLSTLSRIAGESRPAGRLRAFAYPVTQYQNDDGFLQVNKGIIASKQVAPGTVLGVGLFRTAPKQRGYIGDMPPQMTPAKRTRRAAVGLSWQF